MAMRPGFCPDHGSHKYQKRPSAARPKRWRIFAIALLKSLRTLLKVAMKLVVSCGEWRKHRNGFAKGPCVLAIAYFKNNCACDRKTQGKLFILMRTAAIIALVRRFKSTCINKIKNDKADKPEREHNVV